MHPVAEQPLSAPCFRAALQEPAETRVAQQPDRAGKCGRGLPNSGSRIRARLNQFFWKPPAGTVGTAPMSRLVVRTPPVSGSSSALACCCGEACVLVVMSPLPSLVCCASGAPFWAAVALVLPGAELGTLG